MTSLLHPNGHFDTLSIARRAQELWAQKQAFLGELDGDALEFWIGRIKTDVLESVWREASREQASFLFDSVQPVYTDVERETFVLLHEQQRRIPIYDHAKFQEFWRAKEQITNTARHRTFDQYAIDNGINREREYALKDIPNLELVGGQFMEAAE